jgi:hypothetical protein
MIRDRDRDRVRFRYRYRDWDRHRQRHSALPAKAGSSPPSERDSRQLIVIAKSYQVKYMVDRNTHV